MDPISITGTAVGIISLAIQLCEAALDFKSGFKSAREDIQNLKTRLKGLEALLEAFQVTWKTCKEDDEMDEQLVNVLKSYHEGIQRLSRKLDKFQFQPGNGVNIVRNQGTKLRYAFDKDTIHSLIEDTDRLREDLNSVMQLAFFRSLRSETNDQLLSIRTTMLTQTRYERDQIQKRISSLSNHEDSHQTVGRPRTAQTGQWIFETPEWIKWIQNPDSVLWLYGDAGTGKSVLCSSIIERLTRSSAPSSSSSSQCAYYYFSFATIGQQSLGHCLISIIAQLCRLHKTWPAEMTTLDEASQPHLSKIEDMTQVLKTFFRLASKTYLVFDALDEYPESSREEMLTWLEDIHTDSVNHVSILISSRNHKDIEESLTTTFQALSLCIDKSRNRGDILSFVEAEMLNHRKLKDIAQRNPEFAKVVKNTLVGKADGMFKWTACQIESLKTLDLTRENDALEILSSLPKDLHQTYEKILTRINPRYHPEIHGALFWLMEARRPLTVEELAEACLIDTNHSNLVDESKRFDVEQFFNLVPDLVYIERRRGAPSTVRLAHFTVKEYLTSNEMKSSPMSAYRVEELGSKLYVTTSCLLYILYGHARRHRPMMRYACESWVGHYTDLCETFAMDFHIGDLVSELFNTPAAFLAWRNHFRPDDPFFHQVSRAWGSPIYVAIFFGLSDTVAALASQPDTLAGVNAGGGHFGSVLQAAAAAVSRGAPPKIFYQLLELGADPNLRIDRRKDNNVLGTCAFNGQFEFVEELLRRRVDVNGDDVLVLHQAIKGQQTEMVELLIDAGAWVDIVHPEFGTPLMTAARCGNVEIVRILHRAGVSLEVQVQYHSEATVSSDQQRRLVQEHPAALQQAAQWGNMAVLRLLIELGADVNAVGGHYFSPICAAAYHGNLDAIRELHSAGATVKVEPSQPNRANPLWFALYHSEHKAAKLLLQLGGALHGVDAEALALNGGQVEEWVEEKMRALSPLYAVTPSEKQLRESSPNALA